MKLAEQRRLTMDRGLTSMASQISPKYSRNTSDGSQMPTKCNKKENLTEQTKKELMNEDNVISRKKKNNIYQHT